MARAQFEYDEVGNTFWYVIVSFFAVVLFPLTHFLWPSLPKRAYVNHTGCQCEGDIAKRKRKDAIKPWERTKLIIKTVILLVLWSLFIFLAYKVSQIKHEHVEYDPYKILGLDQEADVTEIKKKYRELSKINHPDKGGDAETFDEIVKAYKALTDEETRQNWKLHGNPDGPRAITFGIALPKWIVSEKYGVWVLACYGLVFMIFLPTAVGLWWYNSMKYSADKVLLETTRLYYYFLQKTPSMEINRIIMIIAGSFEFWKKFNKDIIEHETDDVEVPRLMKELRNLGENKKEPPFSNPWSVKARTLLHAYLTRVEIDSPRLETDQNYMVARVMSLLEEYLRVLLQMMLQIPMQRPPTLETLENSLRLFPMFVQAMWPRNSTLLQLPHISEQNIPYLRKNRVITCQDLANLGDSKRRSLLNTITDEQYEDVMYVLSTMPRLDVTAKIEVQGEDDKETVTVGSVVTLKVTLRRTPLLDLSKRNEERTEAIKQDGEKDDNEEQANDDQNKELNKRKIWEKQPKKKTKKGGKGAKPAPSKKPVPKSNALVPNSTEKPAADTSQGNTAPNTPKETKNSESKKKPKQPDNNEEGNDTKQEGEQEMSSNAENGDDDDLWDEHESLRKKDTLLDSEPTNHHEVHCPYYTDEKYEWWYLYLVERKSRRLVSMVIPCKTLDKEKTVELRFSAPPQKGHYYFTLNVRSDSYLDSDYSIDVKMEVQAAREPPQCRLEKKTTQKGQTQNRKISA
ncbi:dnaJ domain-containing protein [Ditylenchus destructor]|nr:dnaJ domain-containing protein [Ditylenchus destructor]